MNDLGIVRRNIVRADKAAVEKLSRFGVATIHEAMGRVGLMQPCMRPIYSGAHMFGTAVTVLLQPGDNWMMHVAAEMIQPGDVVVAACTVDNTDGFFGDLLATSFRARGARGLVIDGGVRERFSLGVNPSERVLSMVHELLGEGGVSLAQLDAIAFGRGPGSFTGLRIAAGVTQGLAFGAGLPVVPVSSLAVLAQGQDADRVLPAFDARMQQVYWAAYVRNATGLVELQGDELVVSPGDISLPAGDGWLGAGSGWDQYHAILLAHLHANIIDWRAKRYPHATDLARLAEAAFRAGRVVAPEQAIPTYIRDDVAIKSR